MEEVLNYKIAVRPDRRRQFQRELTSQMDVALNILTACVNMSELKEPVLEAFASWLRLKHRIPASILASHPLVHTALSSLNSEFLSEASANVVSELIHYTAAGNAGGVSVPLIQVIVSQVMCLKAQLRDSSKDDEDVKAIARLFADMGDAYVELIATGSHESMMIVHALLEVASHPEYDIASMTFNFWHNLQVNLTKRESCISGDNEASIEAERNRRLQGFRPAYEFLVSLVGFRVQYPEDYQELSYEDLKEFKQTRYAVAGVLIDAALVLGGDAALKILFVKLAEAVSSLGIEEQSDWRPAEAALFCIRAIANHVSVVKAEVMPQVMVLLPKLPQQKQLLQTELSSYEAACKADADLQSFDTTLQTRTNRVINSLAVGVEVRALSFDSLKEVTECLLEMNQEVVKVILECKKDIWKNQELFELVEEYFENSLQTLDFCTELERCLKRARDNQLLILVALQQYEEESSEAGGNLYVRTLQDLKNFKAAGDPFTEEFYQIFQSVYRQQILMLDKLQLRKSKLDKKLKYIDAWRKVSSMIFVATFAAVLICSVVAAAMAAPPVAAALAAATSIPIGSMGKWIDSLWKNYENALKGQKEVISSMQAGTYVVIKDLDNIRVLIDRLEIQLESLLQSAEFAIEQEAVKIGILEIKKQLGVFMKNVDELGMQADICSRDIRRARTVVLQRIIKHPNN